MKKKKSQLFTYKEIHIFGDIVPRQYNEPDQHYICKAFLGETLKIHNPDLVIEYEHELPELITDAGPRTYIPDIFVQYISHDGKTIYISDIEINGKIHYKNKHHYQRNKIRRETILNYFTNSYSDKSYPEYKIKFSYITFDTEDFLYNRFDFFQEIFEDKFIHSGIYPTTSAYEKYLL